MKNKFTRRSFIKKSTYTGLAAGVASTVGCGSGSAKNYTEEITAVVIGSGFGGSVAALRLAENGIETALVERGRYWEYKGTDTFPLTTSIANADKRISWLSNFDSLT